MQAQAPPQVLMRFASQSPLPSAGISANTAGRGSSARRVAPTPVRQVTTQDQSPPISLSGLSR